jgi:uncharacterized phage protein (TIGR02218 family)
VRTISAPLLALLATGNYVSADCWTITLAGGGVVRWTSADIALTVNGNTFAKGPAILRGAISEKRGVEVATLAMDITASPTDLINGTPIIPFIAKHGLDGASVKLERAFAPNWLAAGAGQMTGSIIRFAGRVTSINSIKGIVASLTVSSWMVLLNASMPRNLYQAGCLHTVYDAGCTLNPASFSASSTVSVGTAGNARTFGCALTPTASDYALGRVLFTSGANAGVSRTIRANDAAGNFTLIAPLPAVCAAGDGFTVYKGCDHTQATCTTKFTNLPNFRGTPFVPLPTTAVGSVTTTTTTGGK